MKRYEKYKSSGIEWLGEIPENWEVKRVKDAAQICNGKSQIDVNTDDETRYPIYGSGGIMGYATDFIYKKASLLLGRKGTIDKPIFVVIPFWTIDTMFYTKINDKSVVHKYFYYSSLIFPFKALSTNTALPSMTQQSLSLCQICFPPFTEQTAIANYLDNKTAAIDRKIELLTAKADKYKALRRSLINETVCRGLNPNAVLKDSGIEWIGMIPEHWDEYRMKDLGFLYSGLSGKAGDDFNQDENENNCDFIPFTNIFNNDMINPEMMGKVVVFDNEKQNKVKRNDLFFLMSSEDYDGLGKSSLLAVDLKNTYLNSFCKGFRITRKKVLPAFLNYQLQSDTFRKIMQIEGKGFTRMNLKMEKVNDFTIYIPDSIEEQATIVKYLNERNAQIDTILTNISEQITKLTQLRKTLINDVVTGKIKVIED